MISVIVPIYNSEMYVEDCIESILNQSYTEFELILVNDGSTDNSLSICERYKSDKRVTILSIKNGGPSAAKNCGIDVAKGDYVVFCDSDDTVDRDYLKDLMIDSYDFVVSGYTVRFEKTAEKIINLPKENDFFGKDTRQLAVNAMGNKGILNVDVAKRYKNDILKANSLRFSLDLPTGEDLEFNCSYISLCNNIALVKKANYNYYRRDTGSQVSAYRENQIEIAKKCIKSVENLVCSLSDEGIEDQALPSIYIDYYSICINNLYRKQCKKNDAEKIASIEAVFEEAKGKLNEMYSVEPRSKLQDLFLREVKRNNARKTHMLYKVLFWMRYNFEWMYLSVRKKMIE